MPEPRRHRFFLEPDQLVGSSVRFSPGQLRQIKQVLRLQAGDTVRVFTNGSTHDSVAALTPAFEADLTGELIELVPESRVRLAVYPALVQRDKFEQVLQKLTEVGVAEIRPILTERGLVRTADDSRAERWQAILREAAEQSGRGSVPALFPAVPLQKGIESAAGLRLVAHVDATSSEQLRDVLAQEAHSEVVSLFIGAEGGFSSSEVEAAHRAGARIVFADGPVLRTETASPVLSALVLFALGTGPRVVELES